AWRPRRDAGHQLSGGRDHRRQPHRRAPGSPRRADRNPPDDEPILLVRSPHRRRLGGGRVHPAGEARPRTAGLAVHRLTSPRAAFAPEVIALTTPAFGVWKAKVHLTFVQKVSCGDWQRETEYQTKCAQRG